MEEGFPSSTNSPLTGPFGQPLIEFPSTIYHDSFSSYHFPPDMYNSESSGMHASTYNYTYGIVNPPLDPKIVSLTHITIVSAASL